MTRKPPFRAILLARVSTDHPEQDTSPDRQLARLEQLAASKDWTVVDRIVERESGTSVLGRPAIVRALERILDGRADVLVVDHLFRLGRNVKEMLEVVDTLERDGAHFVDATHGMDTTSPFGRMIFTVLGAVGEFQAADGRAKIMEGLARARARGVRLGKPSKISDAAKARAVALRREENDDGSPRYSWAEIRLQLQAEGHGKHSRGAIALAVSRYVDATPAPTEGGS